MSKYRFVHRRCCILRNVYTHRSKCFNTNNNNNKNVNERRRSRRTIIDLYTYCIGTLTCVRCLSVYVIISYMYYAYIGSFGSTTALAGQWNYRRKKPYIVVLYNNILYYITIYHIFTSGFWEIILHCLSKYNNNRLRRRVLYSILMRATFIRLA